MRKGERRRTRKRRLRCHWCGNVLKVKYFMSPENGRFCDQECYAQDIEYELKHEERKRKEASEFAGAFFKMLFGGAERQSGAGISADMYKKLIFLCHPDKHNNHPWAEEVTKWLLSERSKSKQ